MVAINKYLAIAVVASVMLSAALVNAEEPKPKEDAGKSGSFVSNMARRVSDVGSSIYDVTHNIISHIPIIGGHHAKPNKPAPKGTTDASNVAKDVPTTQGSVEEPTVAETEAPAVAAPAETVEATEAPASEEVPKAEAPATEKSN